MKKLKSNSGFTLAETIIAVGLVLIVSGMLVTGLPRAMTAYQNIVDSADAHTLISTTMIELRDKLVFARNLEIQSDNKTIHFIGNDGREYSLDHTDNGLQLTDMSPLEVGRVTSIKDSTRLLVSNSASSGKLIAKYDTVTYDQAGKYLSFINLQVCRKSEDKCMVTVPKFDVKVIINQN